jgi:tetratricopeptide (TPR) repeat protein
VIEAYAAVLLHHPDREEVAAEAQFRVGEILRAAGRPREASAAFEKAYRLGKGTDFRARALLEIGHIHRRAGRVERALDAYSDVVHDWSARPSLRDLGGLWAGRMRVLLGRAEEARRTFLRLSRTAERPVVRVRAYDRLALLEHELGIGEAARALLQRCLRELRPVARERTRLGAEVTRALRRMRARRVLEGPSEIHGASVDAVRGPTDLRSR